MSKQKETKSLSKNSNGTGKAKGESLPNNQKEPKSYKSVMKAFEMTHKRLHPELYKTKNK